MEALQSGIVYGFAGQVEGIARRMAAELSPADPGAVTIVATGGLAPLVIDEVSVIHAYEPWLTLIGLRLVYERTASLGNRNPAATRPLSECRPRSVPDSLGMWITRTSPSRRGSGWPNAPGSSNPASTLTRWAFPAP